MMTFVAACLRASPISHSPHTTSIALTEPRSLCPRDRRSSRLVLRHACNASGSGEARYPVRGRGADYEAGPTNVCATP